MCPDLILHVNWPSVARSNVIQKQMQNLKEKKKKDREEGPLPASSAYCTLQIITAGHSSLLKRSKQDSSMSLEWLEFSNMVIKVFPSFYSHLCNSWWQRWLSSHLSLAADPSSLPSQVPHCGPFTLRVSCIPSHLSWKGGYLSSSSPGWCWEWKISYDYVGVDNTLGHDGAWRQEKNGSLGDTVEQTNTLL